MRKKIKIKLFKLRANSNDNKTRIIVVGYNNKVNGKYLERIGVFIKENDRSILFINIKRLTFWLERDVVITSKVSWLICMLSDGHKNQFIQENVL